MALRRWIGVALMLTGMIFQPIGWMHILWVQGLSLLLVFVGVFLLVKPKNIDQSVEKEGSHPTSRRLMPGDLHDHSGWGKGGRSESWNREHGSGSGGEGGGD
ncbi:hypothetical protein [Leucothrix arctica]|nr:hypothetical protein [Leucothrix arctica]